VEANDGGTAIEQIAARSFDLIVTDLTMPRADGFEVLRRARDVQPKTPVIVLTAEGSIRSCVDAMRAGAHNFLTKPFHPKGLLDIVSQAIAGRRIDSDRSSSLAAHEGRPQMALIGDSPLIQEVISLVERVASTTATVLITGESGTGKEVVARLLHGSSGRSTGPFIAVNCGAIPESLVESELFGHVKGAFTGANESRSGKFVQANGGTLFLDEIGELPLSMQVKLLRVLQEREVTPIGDARSKSIDVRIIAATNVDLAAKAQEGRFRHDLFYRLEVLPIHIPALRNRLEDIIPLARHFLDAANRRLGAMTEIGEDALAVIKTYSWPGNVREMENLFERLVILSRSGTIRVADLPPRMRAEATAAPAAEASTALARGVIDLDATLASIQMSIIEQALRQADGNKTRAAELLTISRTTLIDRLKRR
jgi:DNA-binding NtrC family response regulator